MEIAGFLAIDGDGREEVIIWYRNEIAIYWNPDPPPRPVPPQAHRPRLPASVESNDATTVPARWGAD